MSAADLWSEEAQAVTKSVPQDAQVDWDEFSSGTWRDDVEQSRRELMTALFLGPLVPRPSTTTGNKWSHRLGGAAV